MLPKLEKEVLEWEQKFKSLTAIDDLKRKIDKLKEEMAWAFVIEKEKVHVFFNLFLRTNEGFFIHIVNNNLGRQCKQHTI